MVEARPSSRPRPSRRACVCGEANSPRPCTTSTLRCFASPARPFVSLPTTPAFHAAQLRDVDLRLCRTSTPACAISSASVIDLRDVQQRFRRNAADVQAHAAQRRIALDEHRLLAEIGRAESRGVAAGPGAQHDDFGVDVGLSAGSRRGARRRRATKRGRGAGGGGVGGDFSGVLGALACGAAPARSARFPLPALPLLVRVEREQQRAFGTLSPTLIFRSFTTPAAGDGTSIVALSDSSVTSVSSCRSYRRVSPALRSRGCRGSPRCRGL